MSEKYDDDTPFDDDTGDYGDDSATDSATMRGEDWPCLRQFCVFLENRVGHLHELLRTIERHDIRVVGLSIVDSVDVAIARLVMSDVNRSRELLALSNLTVCEIDVIGVLLPDDSQPFLMICEALLQAELNVHYTYPLLYRKQGQTAIALYVDDVDRGLEVLREKGHQILTENDLLNDDEFF